MTVNSVLGFFSTNCLLWVFKIAEEVWTWLQDFHSKNSLSTKFEIILFTTSFL